MYTESLCGAPPDGTDAEVATYAQGIAVVEATGAAVHDDVRHPDPARAPGRGGGGRLLAGRGREGARGYAGTA
ncbi:hypothetical protein ACFYYB_40415 [Streptomyces sp. NPDC002886]|uniref:hypothetical protein n=1 Tax=Streptomyces sp. NPDC002886 TaxID=3364667 RepID=UPI00368AA5F9